MGPRHFRISGTLEDFRRLARLVEEKMNTSLVGDKFLIDKEYSKENEIALEFEVREEGFGPSNVDPYLPSNGVYLGQMYLGQR